MLRKRRKKERKGMEATLDETWRGEGGEKEKISMFCFNALD